MSKYTVKKVTDHEKESAKTIEIEIDSEDLNKHRTSSLKSLIAKADVQGFRKGHVPEKVIIEKLGETGILEETINSWIREAIPEILEKEASEALTFPEINITKAVPGNPVELSLFISLRPKLVLPDYKKIASEKNQKKEPAHKIEEKEIEDAILRLRKYATKAINPELKTEPKEEELPPLNDQFAESVGGGKTVDELKERIKKDLESEHKIRAKEKHRLQIIEEILKETKGAIPQILIKHELEKMDVEFENDIIRMGLKMEDYLKNAKKTREDLQKDWRQTAEKRAKISLILAEIKKAEKLEIDKEIVEKEVNHVLEHYKDASPENIRAYIERSMSNDKVFEFLESQE